ncbi:hypothetical protein [Halobacteriovorax sp. DPLXC-1]|uniref:hypothetical protein n=1 Tax=Halobacteriovorax sp. DPLXC-1 TaxID=3110771 RepID=UPI002FF25CF4
MKNLFSIIGLLFTVNQALATDIDYQTDTKLYCSDDVSGLYYQVNFLTNGSEKVYILASRDNIRFYGHTAYKQVIDGELIIDSQESGFGIAYPINDLSEAYYYDGGDSRSLECTFYDRRDISDIALPKKLKFIRQLDNKEVYITDSNGFSFEKIVRTFDHKVVDMGDWYPVILDENQHKLVHSVLYQQEAEFKEIIDGINNSDAEYLGMIFGRDWYYGDGRVGLAIKYQDKLILLMTNFSRQITFGDDDLDYVY